jgi:hypothetical protein
MKFQTSKTLRAFGVTGGEILGFKKLQDGIVFYALPINSIRSPNESDYTCELNGIPTEEYTLVFRKGRYYVRFYVLGKVFHTEVIDFIEVDMPLENKVMAKVMAKDTTEELAATQDAMLKADMAIINAIQVATEANLEAVKAIQVATEASRALHNELNKIKQKTTKVIGEAIGEAVREANKPIEKAIRNFREANRNFREAERKAKDVPEVPEKSLNDLLNALLID